MSRICTFIDDSSISPDATSLELDKQETHHLSKVLRVRLDQPITVLNGKGLVYKTTVRSISKNTIQLEILSQSQTIPKKRTALLAQAIPKGKTMDSIIRHATEIGVDTIVPILSENSEFRLDTERANVKLSKWKQVAIEACKQSENPFLPQIAPITPLSHFLDNLPENSNKFIASLEKNTVPPTTLASISQFVGLVGPEGDFSQKEYQEISKNGFSPISLGDHILRSETASLVMSYLLCNALSD